MGWHDTAQVCLNGHVISDSVRRSPEFARRFCKKCGAKTITNCPSCSTDIQGDFHVEGVTVIGAKMMDAPRFCHECGRPYPWTASRIEAAKALAAEIEELNDSDRILLQASIDDLVADTPRTTVAVARFKKLATKGGRQAVEGFKAILIDIVSEAVKKGIWG